MLRKIAELMSSPLTEQFYRIEEINTTLEYHLQQYALELLNARWSQSRIWQVRKSIYQANTYKAVEKFDKDFLRSSMDEDEEETVLLCPCTALSKRRNTPLGNFFFCQQLTFYKQH